MLTEHGPGRPSPHSSIGTVLARLRWGLPFALLLTVLLGGGAWAQDGVETPPAADGVAPAALEKSPSPTEEITPTLRAAAESAALLGLPPTNAPRDTSIKGGVRVDLLANRPELVPGESFGLSVIFYLGEGWHVYHGPNPGDIGLPTAIEWKLPKSYEHTAVVWPAPERYPEASGDVSYVHEEELILPITIQVPLDAVPGQEAVLEAEIDYQACKDKCMRGAASLSVTIPIVAQEPMSPSADCLRPFARAAKERPRAAAYGYSVEAASSHSMLRPGDEMLAVAVVQAPEGGHATAPTEKEHPLVVFERHDDIEIDVLEVQSYGIGGLRIVTRLTAGEELDVSAGSVSLSGIVQVDIDRGPKNTERTAFAVKLPIALGGADATPELLASALLGDIDVDSTLSPAAGVEVDPAEAKSAPAPQSTSLPLWQALLFAFLGGLILNIMPCVLPVLSLKALALVEEANHSKHEVRSFVGMYVFGVVASFWALAAVVIVLKYSGEYVGWGFQFQEPAYVLVMGAVVFAFALSMFGVFEIPGLTTGGSTASGLRGSFIHGVLTTALSTPCSAPMLGPALAVALSQSPAVIVASFTLVGLGLATPISIVTLAPAARRFIPRPGAWMETFKHIVGFFLVGTAVWLVSVLNQQVSPDAMTTIYILFTAIALGTWILGRFTGPLATMRRRLITLSAAALVILTGATYVSLEAPPEGGAASLASDLIEWRPFDGDETLALAAEGNTVFIDFTADWCATCKTMEETAIETEAVAKLIRESGIVAVKADLTRKNPEISRWVEFYGRAAIPLYVILPSGKPDSPILLPEVITEDMLLDALRKAGPSTSTAAAGGVEAASEG